MAAKNKQSVSEDKTSHTKAHTQKTNKNPKSASKLIGSFADKMIDLTQIGAKKIEDYAIKSAEENDNKNARKLATTMNKFSKKLKDGQEQYVDNVEKNAEELIEMGKQTLGNVKKVYKEMKTRAKTAKNKAEQDVKIVTEEKDNN